MSDLKPGTVLVNNTGSDVCCLPPGQIVTVLNGFEGGYGGSVKFIDKDETDFLYRSEADLLSPVVTETEEPAAPVLPPVRDLPLSYVMEILELLNTLR